MALERPLTEREQRIVLSVARKLLAMMSPLASAMYDEPAYDDGLTELENSIIRAMREREWETLIRACQEAQRSLLLSKEDATIGLR